MTARLPSLARRLALRAADAALAGALAGLEVASDLTPGVRMTGRRRLPRSMAAGLAGAEVATWAAISPSLLPRPWWVTAANVALGQALGHAAASAGAWGLKRGLRRAGRRPQDRVGPRLRRGGHLALGAITVAVTWSTLRNLKAQARLVNLAVHRRPQAAARGAAVGTLGYGALLLLGEAAQAVTTQFSHQAQRWLPRGIAWALAVGVMSAGAWAASDLVVWRRLLHSARRRAARLNRLVYPGSMMPWEPERTGSPWSREPWTAVGSQGRAFLTRGPRALDITRVMEPGAGPVREPIRVFAGLVPGRSPHAAARLAVAELERTGAFRREAIVVQMPAGSGWINNYTASAYEFLTRGDCATVAVQYSFLPSVFSFVVNRAGPVEAAGLLLRAVRARLDAMDPCDRPALYFSGESLGCYALVENFEDAEELLAACDGAVFTGPPRMTAFVRRLLRRRDRGSLERQPVIDGGRHIRFAAHPVHLERDSFDAPYAESWQAPRVVFAQHASDPIAWWDLSLMWRRPDWLREATPAGLRADTFRRLPWVPVITWWQVALDQLVSLNVPGGHGHNYFEETFWYWDAVLTPRFSPRLTEAEAARMRGFVEHDQQAAPSDFRERIRTFGERHP